MYRGEKEIHGEPKNEDNFTVLDRVLRRTEAAYPYDVMMDNARAISLEGAVLTLQSLADKAAERMDEQDVPFDYTDDLVSYNHVRSAAVGTANEYNGYNRLVWEADHPGERYEGTLIVPHLQDIPLPGQFEKPEDYKIYDTVSSGHRDVTQRIMELQHILGTEEDEYVYTDKDYATGKIRREEPTVFPAVKLITLYDIKRDMWQLRVKKSESAV